MKIICLTVKFMLFTLVCLMLLFILATAVWIIITPYTCSDFFTVLSLILKHAGAYSALLVGVVITIFIQIYTKEKELENEERIKVSEIGYYTLTFPQTDESNTPKYNGDRIVVEIQNQLDYKFNPHIETQGKYHFLTSFQTSKKDSANLKNVMAFGDVYFNKNKQKILQKYFDVCNTIEFSSPSYCTAMPTSGGMPSTQCKENETFWLILNKTKQEQEVISFWVSAITEEGILLLVKVKINARITEKGLLSVQLLQQTTYYKKKNKLKPLYR